MKQVVATVRTDLREKSIYVELEESAQFLKLTAEAAETLGEKLISAAQTLKEHL